MGLAMRLWVTSTAPVYACPAALAAPADMQVSPLMTSRRQALLGPAMCLWVSLAQPLGMPALLHWLHLQGCHLSIFPGGET